MGEASLPNNRFLILQGDAGAIPLANDSVDMVMCSPPY